MNKPPMENTFSVSDVNNAWSEIINVLIIEKISLQKQLVQVQLQNHNLNQRLAQLERDLQQVKKEMSNNDISFKNEMKKKRKLRVANNGLP